MDDPGTPEIEAARKLVNAIKAITAAHEDSPADQFRKDFERLAFQIVDPDWHLPPEPHDNSALAPFRNAPLPRRLAFGPLRRMARLLGIEILEYLIAVGSDNANPYRRFRPRKSWSDYKLDLRKRKDKEFPDGAKRRKSLDRELDLERFGRLVLGYEDQGLGRGSAQRRAAIRMGKNFRFRNNRTLIRMFGEFAALSLDRSEMQNLIGEALGQSRAPLDRLARARPGAKRNSDRRQM